MKTVILALLFPVVALADSRIETIDRGDAVEIIAHDVTAANTTLVPVRSRLEIAVANKPAPIDVPSSDKTVVVSELTGKTLSVKTAFDRAEVKSLAAHAKAMQIGPDLHILIPRAIPAAGTAFELPEPTMADVPKVVKVEIPEAPKPEVKAEAPKAEAPVAAAPVEEPKPVMAKAEARAEKAPLPTKKDSQNPMSKAGMLAMMAFVAIGCGFWLMKKRKKQASNESSIEVLAQHSLGAKAKVVWIAAGSREMVLAVTPQGVRMLGSWEKSRSNDAEDKFQTYTENGTRTRLPTAQVVDNMPIPMRAQTKSTGPMVDRSSPAVSGLLKLRAQTTRPVVDEDPMLDDDVKTEDVEADALWAKEILAATKASNSRAAALFNASAATRGARR